LDLLLDLPRALRKTPARNNSMSGTMLNTYECKRDSWTRFLTKLESTGFWRALEGDLESSIFIDIKHRKDGPHGVWLEASLNPRINGEQTIGIAMRWLVRVAGSEPESSKTVASSIEALIIQSGATEVTRDEKKPDRNVRSGFTRLLGR
jgi:hypothetical protein